MKLLVDLEACVGAAQCLVASPDLFDVDDDGKVVLLFDEPTQDNVEGVRAAVLACPAFALELDES